jgi:UDP-4-keto-D-QuiNAc 4-reductase
MTPLNGSADRRVFISGATGFVGRHLGEALARQEWQVMAGARREARTEFPGVTHQRLELFAEPQRWREAMQSCRAVVHLAARVHELHAAPQLDAEYSRVNVEGSEFVARQALDAGVPRFIFLSSVKVNGEGGAKPYRTVDPPDPKDPYGRSKLAAERRLQNLCSSGGMDLVIIRPPLVYGPGVRANFRRLLRLAASGVPLPLASIRNRRSFIGVSNLCDFIEKCLTHSAAGTQPWLISDDDDLSTPELLDRLRKHLGRPSRDFNFPPTWLRSAAFLFGLSDTVHRLCSSLQVDSSDARELLGWRPPLTTDEELSRTVTAYLAERA